MADDPLSQRIVDLYEQHAQTFDRQRPRGLIERAWLDRFTAGLPPSSTVLDIGCGSGEPLARHLIEAGYTVVGVDSSATMIAMCRERFSACDWHVGDMRSLSLGFRVDGLLAWDSFFHLTRDDQRKMFPRFADHARAGAPLMFTSGPADGEAIGALNGDALYHSSLALDEYEDLLRTNGFTVEAFQAEDPDCGGRTVWLARAGSQP